jgi:hypothetical protein
MPKYPPITEEMQYPRIASDNGNTLKQYIDEDYFE